MDIYEEIVKLRRDGRRGALATIVNVRGSIPSFETAKMLVRDDGSIVGTIGGGFYENDALGKARGLPWWRVLGCGGKICLPGASGLDHPDRFDLPAALFNGVGARRQNGHLWSAGADGRRSDDHGLGARRCRMSALTNVVRHSKATRVDVSVRRAGTAIVLGVEDNGAKLPGAGKAPLIHIKRIYHRTNPILTCAASQKPPHSHLFERCFLRSAGLLDALEGAGVKVVETDLGEYILQLAKEPPSHIIAPVIHKGREEIADLFAENRMRDANHGGIGNTRVFKECRLDLD